MFNPLCVCFVLKLGDGEQIKSHRDTWMIWTTIFTFKNKNNSTRHKYCIIECVQKYILKTQTLSEAPRL